MPENEPHATRPTSTPVLDPTLAKLREQHRDSENYGWALARVARGFPKMHPDGAVLTDPDDARAALNNANVYAPADAQWFLLQLRTVSDGEPGRPVLQLVGAQREGGDR